MLTMKPIAANTNGIFECLEKGADYIHWEEKPKMNIQTRQVISAEASECHFSPIRQVYGRFHWKFAGARMTLNQDGSVGLMLGATEIGQGADTVFSLDDG